MTKTPLIRSKGSQTVRLPEDVAFPADMRVVTVQLDGERRILTPTDMAWDDFFDGPGIDLGVRDQPDLPKPRSPKSQS